MGHHSLKTTALALRTEVGKNTHANVVIILKYKTLQEKWLNTKYRTKYFADGTSCRQISVCHVHVLYWNS